MDAGNELALLLRRLTRVVRAVYSTLCTDNGRLRIGDESGTVRAEVLAGDDADVLHFRTTPLRPYLRQFGICRQVRPFASNLSVIAACGIFATTKLE